MVRITLKPLAALSRGRRMAVRLIRNEAGVRSGMYTDHIISEGEHSVYLRRLLTDTSRLIFAVLKDNEPIGCIGLEKIDLKNKKSSWTYFLTEKMAGQGIGGAVESAFYALVFREMDIDKLYCTVLATKKWVKTLHEKYLWKEEGFARSHIIKNGVRIGIYFMGLTREEWDAGKDDIPVNNEISVTVVWNGPPEALRPPVPMFPVPNLDNHGVIGEIIDDIKKGGQGTIYINM